MAEQNTVKIASIAKDLAVKPKDILKILTDHGISKGPSANLTDEEVSLILYLLATSTEVEDINPYISGDVPLLTPEKQKRLDEQAAEKAAAEKAAAEKAAAEKAAAEKAAAEKAAAEKAAAEKAAAEKAAAEKAAAQKVAAEKAAAQKASSEKNDNKKAQPGKLTSNIQARKSFEERVNDARIAAEKEKAKAQDKKNKPMQKREEKKEEKKIAFAGRADFSFDASTKKEVFIVDTKGVDVDLSKYDEKIYNYDTSDTISHRSSGSRNNQRPQRKRKDDRDKRSTPVKVQLPSSVLLPESMIVSELARELRITTAEVVKKLMSMGQMVTLNQSIDYETAAIVAEEFGVHASQKVVVTIEDKLIGNENDDNAVDLSPRSPVVVVMGHVDHGKTSLLDAIRHANVTAGEAGGITQHIGAYRVNINDQDITFLDTPGHEAFTAMRARGAQVTDIAILVVAADDGIMPQTVEAINHAKAAGVSIIVAINKIDKPTANPDQIKQELTKYDLVPEEWGGDVICVPVSAITKQGIDQLLESVLLVAEMAELKANPNRRAKGVVIEAKLDKGRGPVATILVQNGTLRTGDVIIAGSAVGRVRAMYDDKGKQLKEAGPSVPVEILGLAEVPGAGDIFNAVEDERMARELAEQRKTKEKEDEFKANSKVSLTDLFSQIQEGVQELSIVVKADVQGSAEAVKISLEKLSNSDVRVRVIHSAVGGINESDVMLASASNAIIIGFNVRPDKGATDSAARQKVDIRCYRIIYECLEEIQAAMKGMLAPTYKEVVLGHAEVRQTIHVPSVGTIAGSYVQDGKVTRNAQIRILRDSVIIFEDKIDSLRRFKDDVKEVNQGYECGIGLEKFNDIKEGDILEAFVMEEVKA